MEGVPVPWNAGPARRKRVARVQKPFACIITCSDSRVVPELIFDCTIGELFVVRNAGTILTPEVIGSVEFAVTQLGVQLVVVMAHSRCGAIAAAVAEVPVRGAVTAIVRRLHTIVDRARRDGFEGHALESEVSRRNTEGLIRALVRRSPDIAAAVKRHELTLTGAFYDLDSGRVVWQE